MSKSPLPLSVLVLLSLAGLSLSCGGRAATGPKPEPALGSTGSSQLEFRQLASAWRAASPEARNQLEGAFRAFLGKYPRDDLRRPANVYLAWILIQKGKVIEARELIDQTHSGPVGTAHDFSVVARAALSTYHGQPQESMKLLRPLQGKIIDPVERFLATEQLVYAAMASEFYAETLVYVIDWIEQAEERDREAVRDAAESLLRRIPTRYLKEALAQLEPDETPGSAHQVEKEREPQRFAHRLWLFNAVSQRLGAVALETEDVALAAQVLSKNPGIAKAGADELVRLATGGETSTNISGSTVGLLLSTRSSSARRRSAEVAAGLAFAFQASERAPGARSFSLLLAEDNGQNTERALRELSSGGAAVLVAGFDPVSSKFVANHAARVEAPLLLIEPLSNPSEFVFELGVSEDEQVATLVEALAAYGISHDATVSVGDPECAAEESVGSTRFPVSGWKKSRAQAVLLIADPGCAAAAIQESQQGGFHPTFALTLDVASVLPTLQKGSPIVLNAGHFPPPKASSLVPKSLLRFVAQRRRSPTWYESLGYDAGLLIGQALSSLPNINSDQLSEVQRFHGLVRSALGTARTDGLWTSTAAGFDERRALKRELHTQSVVR